MTEAKQQTREEALLEQFKDGLDPNGAAAIQMRVEELEAELAAAKKATAAAKKEAKVARAPASAKARSIGPVPALDADGRAALLDEMREDAFQVVFSDGKREVREIEPLLVSGDAWAVNSSQFMLKESVIVEGAAAGGRRLTVAGFGLVDRAGKQRAWRGLPDVLTIMPGTRVELDKTIAF